MKQKPSRILTGKLRWWMYGLMVVLLAVLLWFQRYDLVHAVQASSGMRLGWLGGAVAAMVLSVFCTAGVYRLLTPERLAFGPLVAAQTSGWFVNKLLPAGSGAVGVSYLFLRANRVRPLRAAIIVAMNNLIGFVGHGLLFGAVLLVFRHTAVLPASLYVAQPHMSPVYVFGAAGALLCGGGFVLSRRFSKLSRRTVEEIVVLARRRSVAVALGISMALTACYVGALYAAGRAVGVLVGPIELLTVLTLSVGATAIVPVPGGIGAAEVGVFVGLRAFHVPGPQALLVALVFRMITFWLPLALGAMAMAYVARKGYLRTNR